MLCKGLEIEGGTVFVPQEYADMCVVVKTDDSVWMWHPTEGSYLKVTISDGVPSTEGYYSGEPKQEPKFVFRLWNKETK